MEIEAETEKSHIEFDVGDLVWVQRGKTNVSVENNLKYVLKKNFRFPWPGLIEQPPFEFSTRKLLRTKYWVRFLGKNHYAWVSKHKCKPFNDRRNYSHLISNAAYLKAVRAAKSYRAAVLQSHRAAELQSHRAAELPSHRSGPQPLESESCSEEEVPALLQSNTPSTSSGPKIVIVNPSEVPEFSSDGEEFELYSHPFSELGLMKAPPCVKKNESMYIYCKLPRLFPVNRQKNPVPTDAIVMVEPLDPVIRSASKIILRYSKCSKRKNMCDGFNYQAEKHQKTATITSLKVKVQQHVFGIVGCRSVGTYICNALRSIGQPVYVWDPYKKRCAKSVQNGAVYLPSPAEVYSTCDVTFCCLTSLDRAQRALFSTPMGVYPHVIKDKSVVIFSPMDMKGSNDIAEIFDRNGGRYLEAPLFFPAMLRNDGRQHDYDKMVLITAGDISLFDDLKYHLYAITPYTFFVGSSGNATHLCNILNSLLGTLITGISEVVHLGVMLELFKNWECIEDFIHILQAFPVVGNFINLERDDIVKLILREWPLKTSPSHIQKAMEAVIVAAHKAGISVPIMSTANEVMHKLSERNTQNTDG